MVMACFMPPLRFLVMANVTANGMTIEYDVRGSGEPVLLVMGLGGQLIHWTDPFVDLFVDAGYQVIRFDNRDIGLSTQTSWTPPSQSRALAAFVTRRPLKDVGYTLPDMAADAAGLLDALNIDRAHVVGASMGGMISQELAIGFPDKVMSLCSIMSNTGDRKNGGIAPALLRKLARQEPPTRATAVQQSLDTFRAISGPHFDEVQYRAEAEIAVERSFTPDGVARQTAAIAGSRDRTDLLKTVTAPTLVIHGLVDPLVRPSGGQATAQAIPHSRLLAFGDMGHDIPRPRMHEISAAIMSNFARASQPAHV